MKKGIVIVFNQPQDRQDDGYTLVPVTTESMLDTMYEKIGCRLVQAVHLTDTIDLICDEEGLYKGYEFGFRFNLKEMKRSGKPNTNQPILGKCVIAKNINGEWTPFSDETEAIEFMYENVISIDYHIKK